MKRVLSTKILTPSQSQLLIQAGLSLRQYNAISVTSIAHQLPAVIDKAIFTSQNAVDSYLKNQSETKIHQCFCVGEKTGQKLRENGQNVVKSVNNASELAHFISNSYENEEFYYLSGTMRRDELPDAIILSKNHIIEIKTYKTELKSVKIDGFFDGIMFFSPSGVASFASANNINESIAFCIGETTAESARQITDKVVVSNSPLVESVIAKTVKTLKND